VTSRPGTGILKSFFYGVDPLPQTYVLYKSNKLDNIIVRHSSICLHLSFNKLFTIIHYLHASAQMCVANLHHPSLTLGMAVRMHVLPHNLLSFKPFRSFSHHITSGGFDGAILILLLLNCVRG
jgi:hypothetical protein